MNVCIVFYSKTGKTRRAMEYIASLLSSRGIAVRLFMIKPAKEYSNRLLHLNPRILYHALFGKQVEIVGDEKFQSEECSLVVIATPIWYNQPSPPVLSFVYKYAGIMKSPIYCITLSTLKIDYSTPFKRKLESLGFKVVGGFSIFDLEKQKEELESVVNDMETFLRRGLRHIA